MEVLSGTEEIKTLFAPNPRAVVKNMFLTGPQEPPEALNIREGLFACLPEVVVTIEKLLEGTACLE